jgi:hypothetical protein
MTIFFPFETETVTDTVTEPNFDTQAKNSHRCSKTHGLRFGNGIGHGLGLERKKSRTSCWIIKDIPLWWRAGGAFCKPLGGLDAQR